MDRAQPSPLGQLPEIRPEVRTRILQAADHLYEESGRSRFPRVADVRALAKVDMGLVSPVLSEWRQKQTAKPEAIAVAIPAHVRQAGDEALAVVWTAAQELANASLSAAETKWAVERASAEDMRAELAESFDAHVVELQVASSACEEARLQQKIAETRVLQLDDENAELRRSLAQQIARAEQAEARTEEIGQRADDLKAELALAHSEVSQVRDELSTTRKLHSEITEQNKSVAAKEIEQLNISFAAYKGKAEQTIESRSALLEDEQKESAKAWAKVEKYSDELTEMKTGLAAAKQMIQSDKTTATQQAKQLQEQITKLQTERDLALRDLNDYRERAAFLSGQLETAQKQGEALLMQMSKKTTTKKSE